MNRIPAVVVGRDAAVSLTVFCRDRGWRQVLVVADRNTYPALGQALVEALEPELAVRTLLLDGPAVVADAEAVLQIMLAIDPAPDALIAAGSGTITDLVRFVAHRAGLPFVSAPTAPSVDAFTSSGSALVVRGFKQTIQARPPVAVFADLPTLSAAPRLMVSAGFADMVGKYTSLADWRLGRLLWDEPFDESIAGEAAVTLARCVSSVSEIAQASEAGVRCLIEALIDSGIGMLRFGASHPASGAEHHLSHFWEMLLLRQGRPSVLHGLKVGIGTLLSARCWAELRSMSKGQAAELARRADPPDSGLEQRSLAQYFGDAAASITAGQGPSPSFTPDTHAALLERILAAWDEVQRIASTVPTELELRELLARARVPTTPGALGITDSEVAAAERLAHHLRNRFTVLKLRWLLGIGRV